MYQVNQIETEEQAQRTFSFRLNFENSKGHNSAISRMTRMKTVFCTYFTPGEHMCRVPSESD